MHLYCLFLIHILIKAVHFFADPIKRMKLNKPQRYLLSNLHAQCVQAFRVSKSLADIAYAIYKPKIRES